MKLKPKMLGRSLRGQPNILGLSFIRPGFFPVKESWKALEMDKNEEFLPDSFLKLLP